jgi:UDP-N-acetylmuramate dehydrogenase
MLASDTADFPAPADAPALDVQHRVSLREHNTFGLPALAHTLVHVHSEDDVQRLLADPKLGPVRKFILGGGSNVVFTRDITDVVLKIEIKGRRLWAETGKAWIVEAGAGENWHDFVEWTLAQGLPGLENLALIPGCVGATPVQNIGAYGVELQDRFDSLDAVDLSTGKQLTLDSAACQFGYRDSVFKSPQASTLLITRVRFALPKNWKPVLGYADLERKMADTATLAPDAQTIFDWVCAVRRAKLPDPAVIGNAGSYFKNPVVSAEQCRDIIERDPTVVHYRLPDGSVKLAAGWLIDACGWKGKTVGHAGVYEKQALVLVNRGGASGAEVVTLARAIQESVYGRFGIRLEPEPIIV